MVHKLPQVLRLHLKRFRYDDEESLDDSRLGEIEQTDAGWENPQTLLKVKTQHKFSWLGFVLLPYTPEE